MKSSTRTVLYFAAAIVITAFISVAVTVIVINGSHGDRVVLNTEDYQKYQEVAPLKEIADLIEQEYYGEADRETLIVGALSGMMQASGDPYARYYTEQQYAEYLNELNGQHNGIGALLGQPEKEEGRFVILKVYDDSSAQAAGLQAGDILKRVDRQEVDGMEYADVVSLFFGDIGSDITLTIDRDGIEHEFQLTRQVNNVRCVHHYLYKQKTGYIRIDIFNENSAKQFEEALMDLKDRGMRSLVIDLRNNPGGELQNVVKIADMLLSEGTIVTLANKNGEEDTYTADASAITVPLAVIVNENSASASEILAAAVQENHAGLVVGMQTYGKGTVQTTSQLKSNGGWVKLTTQAYYTPEHTSIDGTGVMPDVNVDLSDDLKGISIDAIDQEDDAQLWAALDEVRAQADALETE